jgi:hypothetical protein
MSAVGAAMVSLLPFISLSDNFTQWITFFSIGIATGRLPRWVGLAYDATRQVIMAFKKGVAWHVFSKRELARAVTANSLIVKTSIIVNWKSIRVELISRVKMYILGDEQNQLDMYAEQISILGEKSLRSGVKITRPYEIANFIKQMDDAVDNAYYDRAVTLMEWLSHHKLITWLPDAIAKNGTCVDIVDVASRSWFLAVACDHFDLTANKTTHSHVNGKNNSVVVDIQQIAEERTAMQAAINALHDSQLGESASKFNRVSYDDKGGKIKPPPIPTCDQQAAAEAAKQLGKHVDGSDTDEESQQSYTTEPENGREEDESTMDAHNDLQIESPQQPTADMISLNAQIETEKPMVKLSKNTNYSTSSNTNAPRSLMPSIFGFSRSSNDQA